MRLQKLLTFAAVPILGATIFTAICAYPVADRSKAVSSPRPPMTYTELSRLLQTEYPASTIVETDDGFQVVDSSGSILLKASPSREMSGWSVTGEQDHVARIYRRLFAIYAN